MNNSWFSRVKPMICKGMMRLNVAFAPHAIVYDHGYHRNAYNLKR